MFKLNVIKLSICLKAKRGNRSLREAAPVVGLSPSTLSRIEGRRVDDLSLGTFLALCNWLEMEPAQLLDGGTRGIWSPDCSLIDEIRLLLETSDLPPFYTDLLGAMLAAGLGVLQRIAEENE